MIDHRADGCGRLPPGGGGLSVADDDHPPAWEAGQVLEGRRGPLDSGHDDPSGVSLLRLVLTDPVCPAQGRPHTHAHLLEYLQGRKTEYKGMLNDGYFVG